MQKFEAQSLIILARETGRLSSVFAEPGVVISSEDRKSNVEELKHHKIILNNLGLLMCVKQINRTISIFEDVLSDVSDMSSAMIEVANRLADETELLHLISIDKEAKCLSGRMLNPVSRL